MNHKIAELLYPQSFNVFFTGNLKFTSLHCDFPYRDQHESNSEFEVKSTSKTLEDILKDSDSELEYLDEEDQRPKAKKKRTQAWIQDDPENIVDLADVSASRKITGTSSLFACLHVMNFYAKY